MADMTASQPHTMLEVTCSTWSNFNLHSFSAAALLSDASAQIAGGVENTFAS